MKLFLLLLLLITGRAEAAETIIYNGETVKFSSSTAWDANGSSLIQYTLSPYSKPNHLRAALKVKNWWGAAAYVPSNWTATDLSKVTSLSLAIKSPNSKEVTVSLFDAGQKSSGVVKIALTTTYKIVTIPMLSFTGVDLSKIQAIVFSMSVNSNNVIYKIDIDNIKTIANTPTPVPTPTPTPTPDTTVQLKAASLVKEMTGKTFLLVGEGGLDAQALGLKPNIHYRYLVGYGTGGWRGWNSPDGEYATIVINQAKALNAIPMFTYYQLALEFENKNYGILTSSTLHQYLLDLRVMYQKLGSSGSYALVHLEPDFFGYLQQYAVTIKTNAAEIPAKVRYPDLPECSALPENVGGLLACMIQMGRTLAPKTKIGFHASMWGDWYDPLDPNAPILNKAASVGNFLKSVGSDKTDFIVLETTDRDAGFYEATQGKTNVYWDETNRTLPNFTNHFTWVKGISQTMAKPVLWWQMPFGVPSTAVGGTDGHYRDNRVRYFFSHMKDVAEAGGFGVVYGAGADRQTTPNTDGGQFKNALNSYLAAPVDLQPSQLTK